MPPSPAEVVERACSLAGGALRLAQQIGVAPSAVSNWRHSGIPAGRVPAIARITGMGLHELRPDLFDPPTHPAPANQNPPPPEAA